MEYVLVIAGCLILIFGGIALNRRRNKVQARFTEPVDMEVLDVKYTPKTDAEDTDHYYPTFKYTYNGVEYQKTSGSGFTTHMKVGDHFTIFVDPNSPGEVCMIKGGSSFLASAMMIFGGFTLFFVLLTLLF